MNKLNSSKITFRPPKLVNLSKKPFISPSQVKTALVSVNSQNSEKIPLNPEQTSVSTSSQKPNKQKKDFSKPATRSLTDLEYEEIFNTVINNTATYYSITNREPSKKISKKSFTQSSVLEASNNTNNNNIQKINENKAPHTNKIQEDSFFLFPVLDENTPNINNNEVYRETIRERSLSLSPIPKLTDINNKSTPYIEHDEAYRETFHEKSRSLSPVLDKSNEKERVLGSPILESKIKQIITKKRSSTQSNVENKIKNLEKNAPKLIESGSGSDLINNSPVKKSRKLVKSTEEGPVQLDSEIMSQIPKSFKHRQRLEWLQERRNMGTWVQCSRPICMKWRYLDDVKDPLAVPEEWFCFMNPDKNYANCNAPESHPTISSEIDLIHNKYTAGSIVWARMDGFPWWPAMVDDCPDTEVFYWLNGFCDIPTYYHVVFFDMKSVSRAWIVPSDLQPFKTGTEHVKTKFGKTDYKIRIDYAKNMALDALKLNIADRLKKYSFLAQWKGPIISPKESSDSDNSDLENITADTVDNLSLQLFDKKETEMPKKRVRKVRNTKSELKVMQSSQGNCLENERNMSESKKLKMVNSRIPKNQDTDNQLTQLNENHDSCPNNKSENLILNPNLRDQKNSQILINDRLSEKQLEQISSQQAQNSNVIDNNSSEKSLSSTKLRGAKVEKSNGINNDSYHSSQRSQPEQILSQSQTSTILNINCSQKILLPSPKLLGAKVKKLSVSANNMDIASHRSFQESRPEKVLSQSQTSNIINNNFSPKSKDIEARITTVSAATFDKENENVILGKEEEEDIIDNSQEMLTTPKPKRSLRLSLTFPRKTVSSERKTFTQPLKLQKNNSQTRKLQIYQEISSHNGLADKNGSEEISSGNRPAHDKRREIEYNKVESFEDTEPHLSEILFESEDIARVVSDIGNLSDDSLQFEAEDDI